MASYLSTTRESVRGVLHAQDGADTDTLVDASLVAAPYERLIGYRLDCECHGNPTRHRNTVAKMVEEEISAAH